MEHKKYLPLTNEELVIIRTALRRYGEDMERAGALPESVNDIIKIRDKIAEAARSELTILL